MYMHVIHVYSARMSHRSVIVASFPGLPTFFFPQLKEVGKPGDEATVFCIALLRGGGGGDITIMANLLSYM